LDSGAAKEVNLTNPKALPLGFFIAFYPKAYCFGVFVLQEDKK